MSATKDVLAARLDAAFRGSRHHSLLRAVRGVTADDARWAPPQHRGFPHADGSILNLLYHAGGDKHVLVGTAFGDGSVGWNGIRDRFVGLGGDLGAAMRLAQEGHAAVLAALERWPADALDSARPYYGGQTMPASEVFELMAEHDLYHAGQIVYVRCLLDGRRRASGRRS